MRDVQAFEDRQTIYETDKPTRLPAHMFEKHLNGEYIHNFKRAAVQSCQLFFNLNF